MFEFHFALKKSQKLFRRRLSATEEIFHMKMVWFNEWKICENFGNKTKEWKIK